MLPATLGDNDSGYWESAAVVEIHDQLLRALGSAFDDPFPLPDGWLDSSFARDAQRRLADEIRKDFDGSRRIFVVKDPRIARLLPLWLDLLDKLAIEPVVVIPVRNPLEVAASLGRRDEYSVPPAQSLLLYVRSYLDTELASRGRQRLFVGYEQLLIDWHHFATELGRTVGAPLQSSTADNAAAIDEFLTSDLYHNRASREELARAPGIAATVVEMFDLLAEAAKTGDERSLRGSFDRLRETTSEATRLFQGVVLSERDRAQQQLARLREDHSASEARIAELAAGLAAELAKSAALHGELATMRDRLMERDSALAARSAELSAARGDAAALRADSEARSVEVERLSGRLAAMQDIARRLDEDLSGRLAAMQNLARRLDEDLETVSKERDAIARSTMWRMAQPLRSAGASFPWFARHVRQCLKLVRWTTTFLRGTPRRDRDLVVMSGEPDPEWSAFHARHDKATIALSGLFDEGWYKENYPDVAAAGVDPIEHYLSRGAVEGRDPGPLFNTLGYLSRNPDACAQGQNPLLHYIRARRGTPRRDPDLVAMSAEPEPERSAFHARHDKATIALSGLFDEGWYKENYPDVAAAGLDPIEHYLSCGAVEGRDPSPLFNTLGYLSRNPDACAEGQNPLLHYIRGRAPAGANDPVGTLDEGHVFTLARATVGRLVSSFSKHSSEEEVAVTGVAVSKWHKSPPRI